MEPGGEFPPEQFGRRFQRGNIAPRQQSFKRHDVCFNLLGGECDPVGIRRDHAFGVAQGFSQARQVLPQVSAGLLLGVAAPQQPGQLITGVRDPQRAGQVNQQRLRFLCRQSDRAIVGCRNSGFAQKADLQNSHGARLTP